jgi:hypothetical protein
LLESRNGALLISGAGRRETVSDVTSRKLEHGFLLVFNTYFLPNMHHFKIILDFVIVDYGAMSNSTDRGRPRPAVTSPVDRVTMVSYQCPIHISCLLYTFDKFFALFSLVFDGGFVDFGHQVAP